MIVLGISHSMLSGNLLGFYVYSLRTILRGFPSKMIVMTKKKSRHKYTHHML